MHQSEVLRLIQKYFPRNEWQNAMKVVAGESQFNPSAVGDRYTIRGVYAPSYGLFQIRALPGRPPSDQLENPEFNVRYAASLWQAEGWSPWTVGKELGLVPGYKTKQSTISRVNAILKEEARLPTPTIPPKKELPKEYREPFTYISPEGYRITSAPIPSWYRGTTPTPTPSAVSMRTLPLVRPAMAAEPPPAVPATRSLPTPAYHTVRKGETPGGIAQKYLGDWRRWQELYKGDPYKMQIGLKIPVPSVAGRS